MDVGRNDFVGTPPAHLLQSTGFASLARPISSAGCDSVPQAQNVGA